MKNSIGLLFRTVVNILWPKSWLYSIFMAFITFPLLTAQVVANDFPTLDRALFVQECMALKQSQTYETLYGCSCTLDKIAAEMSYNEFVEADTYVRMRNTRGERGGLFRGAERAQSKRQRLLAVKSQAEAACFAKSISTG